MTTLTTEETGTAAATAAGDKPKATKKARAGARRAHVAPTKGKVGKKTSPAKKAPKGGTKAKVAKPEARDGSKTATILDLLKRPGGARRSAIRVSYRRRRFQALLAAVH